MNTQKLKRMAEPITNVSSVFQLSYKIIHFSNKQRERDGSKVVCSLPRGHSSVIFVIIIIFKCIECLLYVLDSILEGKEV